MAGMADEQAVAWLRAQIEGDKGEAQLAVSAENIIAAWIEPTSGVLQTGMGTEADCWDGTWALGDSRLARFIARHDPQDVIARCESDLALLDLHFPVTRDDYGDREWLECAEDGPNDGGSEFVAVPGRGESFWPCQTLHLLARGFRHREGWAEHWGGGPCPSCGILWVDLPVGHCTKVPMDGSPVTCEILPPPDPGIIAEYIGGRP
jgi:hypothetical protein